MAIWRGVGGVARKVTAEWRGVSGVARKIKAEWRGVSGVARKVFSTAETTYLFNSGTWNLATGFTNVSQTIPGKSYEDGYVSLQSPVLRFVIAVDEPIVNRRPTMRLDPAIDLTDYKYVCVYVDSVGFADTSWYIGCDTNSELNNARKASHVSSWYNVPAGTTLKLDVSSLSGSHYIYVEWGYNGGGDGIIVTSNVKQIYITPE